MTPSLRPSRRAAERRYLPESLPSNLNPQSNRIRQVVMRRRRLHQNGHLNKGRDREQCFLETSAVRPATRKYYHKTVETSFPWASRAGIDVETVPKMDQALVWYLNEKFFDGEAEHVASKERFHAPCSRVDVGIVSTR